MRCFWLTATWLVLTCLYLTLGILVVYLLRISWSNMLCSFEWHELLLHSVRMLVQNSLGSLSGMVWSVHCIMLLSLIVKPNLLSFSVKKYTVSRVFVQCIHNLSFNADVAIRLKKDSGCLHNCFGWCCHLSHGFEVEWGHDWNALVV